MLFEVLGWFWVFCVTECRIFCKVSGIVGWLRGVWMIVVFDIFFFFFFFFGWVCWFLLVGTRPSLFLGLIVVRVGWWVFGGFGGVCGESCFCFCTGSVWVTCVFCYRIQCRSRFWWKYSVGCVYVSRVACLR
jgi:hypothetical protein